MKSTSNESMCTRMSKIINLVWEESSYNCDVCKGNLAKHKVHLAEEKEETYLRKLKEKRF